MKSWHATFFSMTVDLIEDFEKFNEKIDDVQVDGDTSKDIVFLRVVIHDHIDIEHQVNREKRCAKEAHHEVEHWGHQDDLKMRGSSLRNRDEGRGLLTLRTP